MLGGILFVRVSTWTASDARSLRVDYLGRPRKSPYVLFPLPVEPVLMFFKGLYVVTDMYPFHLQARKVGVCFANPTCFKYRSSAAQHMDLRLHCIPVLVAVCIRIPRRTHNMAMGIWYRHYLQRPCVSFDSCVWGGDVRLHHVF